MKPGMHGRPTHRRRGSRHERRRRQAALLDRLPTRDCGGDNIIVKAWNGMVNWLPANSSAAGNESKQISEYASNNSSTNNKRGGMKSRNGRNMKKNVINDDTQGIELVKMPPRVPSPATTPPVTPPTSRASSMEAIAFHQAGSATNSPRIRSILRNGGSGESVGSGGVSRGVVKKGGTNGKVRWHADGVVLDEWRKLLRREGYGTGTGTQACASYVRYDYQGVDMWDGPRPVRKVVFPGQRAFSRAAIFAMEGQDGAGFKNIAATSIVTSLSDKEPRGVSWGYDGGSGMAGIAATATRRRLSKARLAVKSEDRLSGSDCESVSDSNSDSDGEDESEGCRKGYWEYYDGSLHSLKNVNFALPGPGSPAARGKKPRGRRGGISRLLRSLPPSPSADEILPPAQWMTPGDLDDIISGTTGWKAGSGVFGRRVGVVGSDRGRVRGTTISTTSSASSTSSTSSRVSSDNAVFSTNGMCDTDDGLGGSSNDGDGDGNGDCLFDREGCVDGECDVKWADLEETSLSDWSSSSEGEEENEEEERGCGSGAAFAAELFSRAMAESATALLYKRAYLNVKL